MRNGFLLFWCLLSPRMVLAPTLSESTTPPDSTIREMWKAGCSIVYKVAPAHLAYAHHALFVRGRTRLRTARR